MSSTTEEKQQEAVENGVPSPQNTEETTSASEKGRVPIPRFKKPRLIIIIVSSFSLLLFSFSVSGMSFLMGRQRKPLNPEII